MFRLSRRLFLKHLLAGIVSNRSTSFVFCKKKENFCFILVTFCYGFVSTARSPLDSLSTLSVCVTTLFSFYEPTRQVCSSLPHLTVIRILFSDSNFQKQFLCPNKWKERLLKLVVGSHMCSRSAIWIDDDVVPYLETAAVSRTC